MTGESCTRKCCTDPSGAGIATVPLSSCARTEERSSAYDLKWRGAMRAVAVGGTSTITGPFVAALLLGIADVAGKYYVPTLGAFAIYTIMIALLIWRPHGLLVRGARR